MLYVYRVVDGKVENCPIDLACEPTQNVLWIDMVSPNEAERAFVERHFKLPSWISLSEEMEDIELTARFYEDLVGLHLVSLFLTESCQVPATNLAVRFVIQRNKIFTVRERELKAFTLYRAQIQKNLEFHANSPQEHLLNLLEIKTELLADELEFIYVELDSLNETLLRQNGEADSFDALIVWLSKLEASSNKIRLCLTDSQRALLFLQLKTRQFSLPEMEVQRVHDILSNIESLIPHNEALCARIEFLTQTTMGFSEIRQNHTMKWMSSVSVLALPLTLLTSWFGMDVQTFFGSEISLWMFQFCLFFIILGCTYIFYLFMRKSSYF